MKEIAPQDFYNYVTSVCSIYITEKKHPISEIIQIVQRVDDNGTSGQLWGTFYATPKRNEGLCIVKTIKEALIKDQRDVWTIEQVVRHFNVRRLHSYQYNIFESVEEFDRYLLVEEL